MTSYDGSLNPAPFDSESLLAHTDWARRLAFRLVSDADQADEIAQEAATIALRSTRPVSNPHAWFSTVVRNLARRRFRDRSRTERRELRAARPERVEIEDVLERAELHHQLTEALLQLSDPYRSTLLLRFFEDLSPKEIGERLNVPSSTVRVWTKRGLDQLRSRLDAQHGDRRTWHGAFVATFGLEQALEAAATATTLSTGTLPLIALGGWIVGMKKIAALIVATVLLIGGGIAVSNGWFDDKTPAPVAGAGDIDRGTADSARNAGSGSQVSIDSNPVDASRSTTDVVEAGSRVAGLVTDRDEIPVPNAPLRFVNLESRDEHLVESDQDGRYETRLANGRYGVLTTGAEWAPTAPHRFDISVDRDNADIHLTKAATLTGIVRNAKTLEPIPGAEVRGIITGWYEVQAIADDRGEFELVGLAPNPTTFSVGASATGFVTRTDQPGQMVGIGSGQTRADFIVDLEPGARITGRVVDETGRAITSAEVVLGGIGWRRNAHSVGVDGGFDIAVLPTGSLFLHAEADDRVSDAFEITEITQSGVDLGDVVLKPGAVVEGRLVDETGAAIANAEVKLHTIGLDADRTARTDAAGRFAIQNLVQCDHQVFADLGASTLDVSPAEIRVEALNTKLDLIAHLGLAISGVVQSPDGQPMPDVLLNVSRNGEPSFHYSKRNGAFTIYGLEDRMYEIKVGDEVHRVRGGQTDVVLQQRTDEPESQTVRVTIVSPYAEDSVRYYATQLRWGNRTSGSITQPKNHESSTFTFDRDPNDVYLLQIYAPEIGEGQLTIETSGSFEAVEYQLVLEPLSLLFGRVSDQNGRPIEGASLTDRSRAFEPVMTLALTTSGGEFELSKSSRRRVFVSKDGYAEQEVDLDQEGSIEITLLKIDRLKGRVTLAGRPIAIPIHTSFPTIEDRVMSDENGRFETAGAVGAGRFMFQVDGGGERRRITSLVDVGSTIETLEFDLPLLDSAIKGRIVNGGQAVADLSLSILIKSGDFVIQDIVLTDEDGRWVLESVPAGKLSMNVNTEGEWFGRVITDEVRPGRNAIETNLGNDARSVSVTVVGRKPNEVSMAIVLPGTIDLDPKALTAAEFMELQSSATAVARASGDEDLVIPCQETERYTLWLILMDPTNPPSGPGDFVAKTRSRVVHCEPDAESIEVRFDSAPASGD